MKMNLSLLSLLEKVQVGKFWLIGKGTPFKGSIMASLRLSFRKKLGRKVDLI